MAIELAPMTRMCPIHATFCGYDFGTEIMRLRPYGKADLLEWYVPNHIYEEFGAKPGDIFWLDYERQWAMTSADYGEYRYWWGLRLQNIPDEYRTNKTSDAAKLWFHQETWRLWQEVPLYVLTGDPDYDYLACDFRILPAHLDDAGNVLYAIEDDPIEDIEEVLEEVEDPYPIIPHDEPQRLRNGRKVSPGYKRSDIARKRIAEGRRGKHHSEETKLKIAKTIVDTLRKKGVQAFIRKAQEYLEVLTGMGVKVIDYLRPAKATAIEPSKLERGSFRGVRRLSIPVPSG